MGQPYYGSAVGEDADGGRSPGAGTGNPRVEEWRLVTTHYLDHAATTDMRPESVAAWCQYAGSARNPSSIHGAGRAAWRVVEDARDLIRGCLAGKSAAHVVFTSGGTEADNLAVLGLARAARGKNPERTTVVVSPLEHHAVGRAAEHLVREGFSLVELPVTRAGVVDVAATGELIARHAGTLALVTCMRVNNEIGTVQPVRELAVAAGTYGVPFHCDGVAGPLDAGRELFTGGPGSTGVTMALSAHKIGGPMGVGALVIAPSTALEPQTFGGDQEMRLRSGTLPVPLIAAFAAGLSAAAGDDASRVKRLSGRLAGILAEVGAVVVGADVPRSPAITYALFPGCTGQDLVMLLDARGIHVSVGSACAAGVPEPSHVLLALGYTATEALSGLRFSLGWSSTDADLDALAAALPEVVATARGL